MKIFGLAAALLACILSGALQAQVPFSRIRDAEREPQSWLTYSGAYRAHRFSPLKQITATNVNRLRPIWVYQLRQAGIFECTPIVADGVIYIVEPPSTVTAPAVNGTVGIGRQLTASSGSFDGDAPITSTFVWQRCDATGAGCKDIVAAKKVVYQPTLADIGFTLRISASAPWFGWRPLGERPANPRSRSRPNACLSLCGIIHE